MLGDAELLRLNVKMVGPSVFFSLRFSCIVKLVELYAGITGST